MAKKNYVTYKDKYNTKYGYAKNASHTLEEVSKDTGVSMKGLQQIYNKGIGAYKTNPSSVRPNVKSKEQWAMARVYSAVMGGKTARIDANELKFDGGGKLGVKKEKTIKVNAEYLEQQFYEINKEMDVPVSLYKQYQKTGKVPREFRDDFTSEVEDKDWVETNPMSLHLTPIYKKGGMALNTQTGENWYAKGGMRKKFAEGGQITQFEIEAMRNYINGKNPNPKLKDSFEKVLTKYGVDLERGDISNFPKGKYVNPYDFEGYEYMRNKNEEAGVYFLLTGEYQLVSKAIYEKDYAMWLFYNYLGRINISFQSCREWLREAVDYFSYTLPVPINLVHTPNAKDGRSFAQWYAVTNDYKLTAEAQINRRIDFQFNDRWYYNEIGLVANGDDKKNGGWGTMYKEKKTGLLIPEYTETSFHFNTLIHEFAHCLDFQTQLVQNIETFQEKKAKGVTPTTELTEVEKALYSKQMRKTELVVTDVIGTHFDTFVDALVRILRACSEGRIPVTQLFEQQAINVQQALSGKYGDLLLAQRERKARESEEMKVADELRDNKRFTWQSSWNRYMKTYLMENAIQQGLKEKLENPKRPYTLPEIIELDNLLTMYLANDYYVFRSRNPSKGQERLDAVQSMRVEANRIINNHYDNIKKKYAYGFVPSNELEIYLEQNCNTQDYRDYKSWKECSKKMFTEFQ
jgi:hypothetical protein